MHKELLVGKNLEEFREFTTRNGQPAYRAQQLSEWVYVRRAQSFEEMSNLPKSWRARLEEQALATPFRSYSVQESSDGTRTRKYLFELHDGRYIESVRIPMKEHFTLCISSQVGCALECAFCLTGKQGFIRQLQAGEILGQILTVQRELSETESRISNIVFMGMGEPLMNYEHAVKAIRVMLSEEGLNFSNRKITLSTAGVVPGMQRLGQENFQINLAVSLNAPNDEIRSRLMPITKRYPLDQLLRACREFPLPERRRITFEYILLDQINDALEHADQVAQQLRGIRCKINLIPFNATPGAAFNASAEDKILAFQERLLQHGYSTFIRASKGRDISAACGQLSGQRQGREDS